MQPLSIILSVCVSLCPFAAIADDIAEVFAKHLQAGQLADAETALRERLADHPQDSQARFARGVVLVLSAIEGLGQDQYRYGALNKTVRSVPILRLPLPENPRPEAVSYPQVRQVFEDFQKKLVQAEAELAKVDLNPDVKLPLDLASIHLDLTGDGKSGDQETLLTLFAVVNRPRGGGVQPAMQVTFDAGDVPWLRGYCHFLAGFCDLVLAYDHQRLFDLCGQLVYPRHIASEKLGDLDVAERQWEAEFIDAIAAIHLMNFPVKEPARMESARKHFLEMIRTSRQSWALILAEDDDDHEWLPNPKQTGVLRIPVTQELVDGWQGVLTEMENLLEGRKLVPFWRDYVAFGRPAQPIPAEGRGLNLKRLCQEPRDFDLILMIQGTAMLPYVEQGELSRPEAWENLTRVFRGQFFGFAIWFN